MKSFEVWKESQIYEYLEAGNGAAPGVKKEIKNFNSLPPEEKKELPLLEFLIGPSTQPYKMSTEDANYTENATGKQRCGNCKFAYEQVASGKTICSMMRGDICVKNGWCRLWKE